MRRNQSASVHSKAGREEHTESYEMQLPIDCCGPTDGSVFYFICWRVCAHRAVQPAGAEMAGRADIYLCCEHSRADAAHGRERSDALSEREKPMLMTLFAAVRSPHLLRVLALLLPLSGIASPASSQILPANTVVKVRLQGQLHSDTARVGDRVRAQAAADDFSGLEGDTTFIGRVTRAQPATASSPGLVEVRFGSIERKGGWQPVTGSLHGIQEGSIGDGVRQDDSGRLLGKRPPGSSAAFIGYGPGGSAAIGFLRNARTSRSITKADINGALAGYLHAQPQKGGTSLENVALREGAEFGIILEQPLAVRRSPMTR